MIWQRMPRQNFVRVKGLEPTMSHSRASRPVVVNNPQGLHARPADLFVKLANQFDSKIQVVKDDQRVDGKSILAILTLAAVDGTKLLIEADGPDAELALEALTELFRQNFAEDESNETMKPS